jgi:hypothetical protein
VDSVGKAMRASLTTAQASLKKKQRERIGVEVLAERFAKGLDLWTGKPLANTHLEQAEPKE